MKPGDYIHSQGRQYQRPTRYGTCVIRVLPELNGLPWDDFTLSYIHVLRPSYIRVIRPGQEETTDWMPWRVTVYVSQHDVIDEIEQEAEVGLPDGILNGRALHRALCPHEYPPKEDMEEGGEGNE